MADNFKNILLVQNQQAVQDQEANKKSWFEWLGAVGTATDLGKTLSVYGVQTADEAAAAMNANGFHAILIDINGLEVKEILKIADKAFETMSPEEFVIYAVGQSAPDEYLKKDLRGAAVSFYSLADLNNKDQMTSNVVRKIIEAKSAATNKFVAYDYDGYKPPQDYGTDLKGIKPPEPK